MYFPTVKGTLDELSIFFKNKGFAPSIPFHGKAEIDEAIQNDESDLQTKMEVGADNDDDHDLLDGVGFDLDENETYALTIICGTLLATFFGTLFVAKVIDTCIDDNDW